MAISTISTSEHGSNSSVGGGTQAILRVPGTNTIYMLVCDWSTGGSDYLYTLHRSTDGGNTWSQTAVPAGYQQGANTMNMNTIMGYGALLIYDKLNGDIYAFVGAAVTYGNIFRNGAWVNTNWIEVYGSWQSQIGGAQDPNGNFWLRIGSNFVFVPRGNIAGAKSFSAPSGYNMGNGLGGPRIFFNNGKIATAGAIGSYNYALDFVTPDSMTAPTTLTSNGGHMIESNANQVNGDCILTNDGYFTIAWNLYTYTQITVTKYDWNGNQISTPFSSVAMPGASANTCAISLFTPNGNDWVVVAYLHGPTYQDLYISGLNTVNSWTNVTNSTNQGGANWGTSPGYDQLGDNVQNFLDIFFAAYNSGQVETDYYYNHTFNNPPNAPTFSNITSSGSTLNGKPKMFFNVSDPDSGNTIQNVEVQVSSSSAFSSTTWDSQYGNDSGYGTQGGTWGGMPTTTNTSSQITFVGPTALAAGTWYVRARCKDNNGAWSAWSATQSFTVASTPWSDTPNGYGLKAQWINDLANVINNARQFRGQSTYTFTDGTVVAGTTDMKAVHITDRRTALSQELSIVGVAPTWTNPTIDNTHDRSGQDIIDLRNYALQT